MLPLQGRARPIVRGSWGTSVVQVLGRSRWAALLVSVGVGVGLVLSAPPAVAASNGAVGPPLRDASGFALNVGFGGEVGQPPRTLTAFPPLRLAEVFSPRSEKQVDVPTALVGGIGLRASGGTASASVTSTAAGAQGITRVDSLVMEVLGLPISATTLSGEVSCPATSSAAGTTTVTGLMVFGRPVQARVNAVPTTVTSPVTVAGLTNATMSATVSTRLEQLTDTTAFVTALRLTLVLDATSAGSPVRVQLGSIDAGHVACSPSYPERFPNPDLPTVAAVTPSSASVAGGTQLTVTGSGFVPGRTRVDLGRGAPASAVTVLSPTRLTFAAPEYVVRQTGLSVITPNGTSGTIKFYYVPPPGTPVLPTATLLYPSAGRAACCTSVQVQGSGFIPGATTVEVDGVEVPAGKVTVDGEAEMLFEIQGHEAGLAQVTVTTDGGTSAPLGFTFVPVDQLVPPGPTVTRSALSPSAGSTDGGTTVAVTGTGFVPGQTTVTIDGVTLTDSAVSVSDPKRLTFITPPHATGLTFLTIRTPFGTVLPIDFRYLPPVAPPPSALVVPPSPAPVEPAVSEAVGTTGPVSPSDAVAVGDTTPRREGGARAGSPHPLASTGVALGPQVAAALAALLVGLLLVGATRRRQ